MNPPPNHRARLRCRALRTAPPTAPKRLEYRVVNVSWVVKLGQGALQLKVECLPPPPPAGDGRHLTPPSAD
ncbi:MAG: hypothetical protein P4N60_23855 [Verrucomicrobiae bacterium]|nr:hypothetical protein [Verrucomicrobiae bacterium]